MLAKKGHPHSSARGKKRSWRLTWWGVFLGLVLGFFPLNFLVQVWRKPTEILRLAGLGSEKSPRQTWSEFAEDCRRHATAVITADFLAALIQVESSGNPLASPAWTWRWSSSPWDWYGPPSSAVGLLQMTQGNFGIASNLCVKDGRIAKEGSWLDSDACKLNGLYTRLSSSDSIEMTAAFLHMNVQKQTAGRKVSQRDKLKLAAVVHLCGPNKGPALIRARFDAGALGRCGVQPVDSYVRLVMRYREQFARASAAM